MTMANEAAPYRCPCCGHDEAMQIDERDEEWIDDDNLVIKFDCNKCGAQGTFTECLKVVSREYESDD